MVTVSWNDWHDRQNHARKESCVILLAGALAVAAVLSLKENSLQLRLNFSAAASVGLAGRGGDLVVPPHGSVYRLYIVLVDGTRSPAAGPPRHAQRSALREEIIAINCQVAIRRIDSDSDCPGPGRANFGILAMRPRHRPRAFQFRPRRLTAVRLRVDRDSQGLTLPDIGRT